MTFSRIPVLVLIASILMTGCQNNIFQSQPSAPVSIGSVPAVRLNFRYEADVPAPSVVVAKAVGEERNPSVQADFDANRTLELLDRTITSPDQKHILAVYHAISDQGAEYRLDMYTPDGKLLKKMTSETMAVRIPDSIVWSPDSNSVAFVAATRTAAPVSATPDSPAGIKTEPTLDLESANANTAAANSNTASTGTTPASPTGILTFKTEQIYLANADGAGVKPLTENEGLIYFYYAWSPDSTMLVSLAATAREWAYDDFTANQKGEILVPKGRPRIIEKNGRERRLDDNQTAILPVWSPDSSKVAVAYDVKIAEAADPSKGRRDTQIRIYDAGGANQSNPTQAAIPLRNQLLISSDAYDRELRRQTQMSSSPDNTQPVPPAADDQPLSKLPDGDLLVSYNPIVEILWTAEDVLYLQTAYLRRMVNEADSVRSYSRWHRLVFTAQPQAPAK